MRPWLVTLMTTATAFAKPKYEGGDWSTLWWLPKPSGAVVQPGTQSIIEGIGIPGLSWRPERILEKCLTTRTNGMVKLGTALKVPALSSPLLFSCFCLCAGCRP